MISGTNSTGSNNGNSAKAKDKSTAAVNVQLTGEQKKMFDSIANALKTPAKIEAQPKVSTITGNRSLAVAVPTGFVLLHNDLQSIIRLLDPKGKGEITTSGSGSGSGGFSSANMANALMGAVAFIGGAVAGSALAATVSSIINLISPGELASDSSVKDSVKAGLAAYIRVYFLAQAAMLAANTVTGAIAEVKTLFAGGAIGKYSSVAVFGANQIGKIIAALDDEDNIFSNGQLAATKLITKALENVDVESLSKESEVTDAVKAGLATYLKAYFYIQSAQLAANVATDTASQIVSMFVTGGVSAVVTTAINTIGKIVGAITGDDNLYTNGAIASQKLITELFKSIKYEDLKDDADIKAAIGVGLGTYIKAYFAVQAANMAVKNPLDLLEEGIADILTFGGLSRIVQKIDENLSGEDDNPTAAKVSELVPKLLKDVTYEDIKNSDFVKEAIKDGISSYIAAYFDMQAANMRNDNNKNQFIDGLAGLFSGEWFKKLGQKIREKREGVEDETETYADQISSIINAVLSDIRSTDVGEEAFQDLKNEIITDIVKSVFKHIYTDEATAWNYNYVPSDRESIDDASYNISAAYRLAFSTVAIRVANEIAGLQASDFENFWETGTLTLLQDIFEKERKAIVKEFSASSGSAIKTTFKNAGLDLSTFADKILTSSAGSLATEVNSFLDNLENNSTFNLNFTAEISDLGDQLEKALSDQTTEIAQRLDNISTIVTVLSAIVEAGNTGTSTGSQGPQTTFGSTAYPSQGSGR